MKNTPNWASNLLKEVLKDYHCNRKPELNWRHSHSKKGEWSEKYQCFMGHRQKSLLSSGCCNKTRIAITTGSSRKDQKLVLLHEIAHWLMPQGEHHGKAFWDLAFDLYRKYKIPMYYALNREKDYRKEATYAYRRNRNKQ